MASTKFLPCCFLGVLQVSNSLSVPTHIECLHVLGTRQRRRGLFMKRLAFAVALSVVGGSAALAADLPPPALPHAPATYVPVIAPPYNWSGFYIGGNLGVGWNGGGSVSDTIGSTFSGSGQTVKFLGGGQVGVNYQFWGGVVIGAEAMFDWLPNTTNTFNATNGAAQERLRPPRRRSTIGG